MYVVKKTPRRGLSRYRGRGMHGLGDAYSDCTTQCGTSFTAGTAPYASCVTACGPSPSAQAAATTNAVGAGVGNLLGNLFSGNTGQPMYLAQTGISTTTLLLLAAAGIGIVFVAMKD